MRKSYVVFLAIIISTMVTAQDLVLLGTYKTGIFDEGAAEICAYDKMSKKLAVVNADNNTVDILDITDPTNPTLLTEISLIPYGDGVNSVAVHNGILAVAVEAEPKQDPGKAVFFDMEGNYINDVTAGSLPDMICFTPDGNKVLTANEGEPNDDYTVDPFGTVSIIDISGGIENLTQNEVTTLDFSQYNGATLDSSIRIFGPGATVAQDLEPEYITVSEDSQKAWVAIQENNALAIIDLNSLNIISLKGLGFKEFSLEGNGIDASNKAADIDIKTWPAYGMYQPDAIVSFMIGDNTYIMSANEGDARDYDGYSEEERVEDLTLNPAVFPNAANLQNEDSLGRLKITTANGDYNDDGQYEGIYSYGARSFSIWNENGELVFDTGDEIEQITAAQYPENFNSNNDENDSFKSRSDDKGPEPEAVEIGIINDITYAFIGLERIGGVMMYDVSDPTAPEFIVYANNRDFEATNILEAGDLGPEDIVFIHKEDAPADKHLIAVSNEVSGTVSIFEISGVTDISENEAHQKSWNVWPNPAKKIINTTVIGDYNIVNINGKLIGSYTATNKIDISDLSAGTYFIRKGYSVKKFTINE